MDCHGLRRPSAYLAARIIGRLSPMAVLVGVILRHTNRRQLPQHSPDCIEHASDVGVHLGRRHAHYAIALSCEPLIAPRVARHVCVVGVLPAVHLDDKTTLKADEVDYVTPDRVLSAKACAVELLAAQRMPEHAFGIAHGLA